MREVEQINYVQYIKRKEQITILTLSDSHIFLRCISAASYHFGTNSSIKLSHGLCLCIELVQRKQIICYFTLFRLVASKCCPLFYTGVLNSGRRNFSGMFVFSLTL